MNIEYNIEWEIVISISGHTVAEVADNQIYLAIYDSCHTYVNLSKTPGNSGIERKESSSLICMSRFLKYSGYIGPDVRHNHSVTTDIKIKILILRYS